MNRFRGLKRACAVGAARICKAAAAGLLSMGLALPLAHAGVSPELARALAEDSGLATEVQWLALATARDLDAARAQAVPPELQQTAERAIHEAFDLQRVTAAVAAALARGVGEPEARRSLDWWRSAAGRRIATQEAAAAAGVSDDMTAWLSRGNATYAATSPARQALLGALEHSLRVTESSVDMVTRTQQTVLEAMARIVAPEVAAQLRGSAAQMETNRPIAIATARGMNLAVMALTYSSLDDADLAAYLDYLRTREGRLATDAMAQAAAAAMTQAATEFARSLRRPGT